MHMQLVQDYCYNCCDMFRCSYTVLRELTVVLAKVTNYYNYELIMNYYELLADTTWYN